MRTIHAALLSGLLVAAMSLPALAAIETGTKPVVAESSYGETRNAQLYPRHVVIERVRLNEEARRGEGTKPHIIPNDLLDREEIRTTYYETGSLQS